MWVRKKEWDALPTKAELKKWCKYAARDTFGIS